MSKLKQPKQDAAPSSIEPVTEAHFLSTYMSFFSPWYAKRQTERDCSSPGVPGSASSLSILEVARNCAESFRTDTYSLQLVPLKQTCKALGVPLNRDAINSIFNKGITNEKK